jgi:hypothetical protein
MINLDLLNQHLLNHKDVTLPLVCYRHPELNLVFYPLQKSASSTYVRLFAKLNWNVIDNNDIDWSKDTVFAHIKDPLVRHRKGIVEGICEYFPEVADFFLTPVGAKFLTNITTVETHSYTIYKWIGPENAVKVYWIPLDIGLDHKQLTFDFLERQGASVPMENRQWFLQLSDQNKSNNNELKLFNMLMAEKTPGEILRYIDFDRCLYSQVINFYKPEPDNYGVRITQLLNSGCSQEQAEFIADSEVESNAHLNWNFN